MDRKITVDGFRITISSQGDQDYICLTDMVRAFKEGPKLIEKWLSTKATVEFLGIWERLHNPDFKTPEFGGFKSEAGSNRFYLSVKTWVEATNAIGILAKSGKYGGGTYAHIDIAYHFGMWLSPEFHLLIVKEFQRLKEDESRSLSIEWNQHRLLAKAGYRIQTDAIKEYLLPTLNLPKDKERYVYAGEADLVNHAVTGDTARSWAEKNPARALRGENLRDSAPIPVLYAISMAETLNKELIKAGLSREQRLKILRESAMENIRSLTNNPTVQRAEKQLNDAKPSEFNDALTTAINYNPREEK